MHEILGKLPPSARVLDLGCADGSFAQESTLATTIRVDLGVPKRAGSAAFVQADAAALPFKACSFAAVVSNHSLEHFQQLDLVLAEVGRVVQPDGALFVAVPDASTLTDKLYRWLARGGGHVNPFTSADGLAVKIESSTGLKHVATRTLYTSLSFLNKRNATGPRPRRLLLVGDGAEWSLFFYSWLVSAARSMVSHTHERLRLGSILRRDRGTSRPAAMDQCLHTMWKRGFSGDCTIQESSGRAALSV